MGNVILERPLNKGTDQNPDGTSEKAESPHGRTGYGQTIPHNHSINTALTQTLAGRKPILAPGVLEYYMPLEKNIQDMANLTYRPMLIGAAQIHYSIPKINIYTVT
jgi:hypothetical protein